MVITPPHADVHLIPVLDRFRNLDVGETYVWNRRVCKGYSRIVGSVNSVQNSGGNGFIVRQLNLAYVAALTNWQLDIVFERTWTLLGTIIQPFSIEVLGEMVEIELTNGAVATTVQIYAALRMA